LVCRLFCAHAARIFASLFSLHGQQIGAITDELCMLFSSTGDLPSVIEEVVNDPSLYANVWKVIVEHDKLVGSATDSHWLKRWTSSDVISKPII
jgi:hypothetical protein